MVKLTALASITLVVLTASEAFAFGKKDVTKCNALSPNAIPNDDVDDSAAIQTCLNNAGSEVAIYFPPGVYTFNSGITVGQNNVTLYSDGVATAQLRYVGCNGDLIRFDHGTQTSFRGKIRNLSLVGNDLCTQTAIHGRDTSWLSIEDVQIQDFTDPGSENSVGVQNDGREGFNIRNTLIIANNPIVMGKNPNYNTIDVDHVHIENVYSIIPNGGTRWHVTLNDNVFVSNMMIDGANPFVGGCGILKWVVTNPNPAQGISSHLKISGVRTEQQAATCAEKKNIFISLPVNRNLQQLIIENNLLGGPSNGFPTGHTAIDLTNVDSITVSDTTYFNASNRSKLINATGAKYIRLENNYFYLTSQIVAAPLVWIEGPWGGKDCCNPPGTRSPDSGILAIRP